MPDNHRLSSWSAAYLIENAPGVMDYVIRGRRYGKIGFQGLRSEYAFGLLRDAVDQKTGDGIDDWQYQWFRPDGSVKADHPEVPPEIISNCA